MQRAAGLDSSYDPLILRNPPFALPLVLPLGYLSQRWATLVWSALLLAAFALSVRLLWDVIGRPKGLLRWLPYGFAPALICILVGQSAILPLLGVVLFFRYHTPCSDVLGHEIPIAGDADGSCSADGADGRRGPARDAMAFAAVPMACIRMAALVSLQSRSCIRG